jgi:hypothetical protein
MKQSDGRGKKKKNASKSLTRRGLSRSFSSMLFLACAFVFLPSAVYAGGGRQIETATADGLDIWQQEFDVSGKKKGTYNIIIVGKDAAGNEGISGPFNIKIDPMAGLPEARVVYPEHGQVVREDVSIVGVASARYGVKQIFVKIDDGEYEELEGGEYWTYYIPAMDLVEGKHTIYVKAVDNHDLLGPEARVTFTLDLAPPTVELIDLQIGDLIAGTVKIEGRVLDANGVKSLALSTDGDRFSNLKLTKKRGEDGSYFNFPIKSKDYEDGPLVCYLRATNNTGNSITRPYLFFVNNFPPQIDIISPQIQEDVYGSTQVTGRVLTGVGLTSFFYEWAGERISIPLRPGDPFWAVTVPISMANNRAIPFRVTAIDKSGNVTVVSQRFQDARRNKTPTLAVDYPPMPSGLGRMNLEWDQPIYGHMLPGFFPYGIIIEGEIEYVMAQPSFRIDPMLIPEGRNALRLWAIDEGDVTGQVFTLRINKNPRPEGAELIESLLTIDSPEEYDWFGESVTINGSIDDYIAGYTLEYRLSWEDNWKQVSVDPSGAFNAVISLADLPEGAVPLEFRTVRNGRGDYPLYFPVNKFVTQPVISFFVPSEEYGTIHGDVTTAGVVDYFVPLTEISYSIDGLTFERLDFIAKYGRSWFTSGFDYTAMQNQNQKLVIRAVDRAGNRVEASPNIIFDDSTDFPTLILNFPLEDEVIAGDFDISGIAFDDDAVAAVFWRIMSPRNPWDTVEETLDSFGDIEFNRFDTEQNFQIPVSLYELRDGENIVEVYVEDMYSVKSEVIQRVFKVSTAVPVTVVTEPPMDIWNRGYIMIRGTSFDLNGIDDVLISMDNGVSYQRADFESFQADPSPWSISINSKAYADGIYSMLVRTIDKYGISSFSNGIINIDNTPPEIDLGFPRNGDKVGIVLSITGQVVDNIELTRIAVQVVNIENPNVQRAYDLPNQFVVMESMDVANFPDGDYTLTVVAFDQSGNETSIVRNFNILKARPSSEIALINPLPGITQHGPVIVSGKITGAVIPEKVTLVLDNEAYADIEVNRYGIFSQELPRNAITTTEPVLFSAYFYTPGGEQVVSFENRVKVSSFGPVLVIDSHHDGDVITRRPYISGRAFYLLAPEGLDETVAEPVVEKVDDEAAAETAEETAGEAATETRVRLVRRTAPARNDQRVVPKVRKVEVSLDNGRSFDTVSGTDRWKYRLETGELERGSLPVIVKATFDDGSVAVRRIMLVVDTRPPVVNTIGPPENSSHRTEVVVYGSSADDFDMDSVEVSLRPGDKNLYAVPAFIQGLYFDMSGLGGLHYSFGLGLTFFDDNVKVQFNAAQAGAGNRYSGWAFGGKVLANVFTKNLSDWFGPDWEFYTTSLTIGAHFSYFLMEKGEIPLVMGELIGQWEMIKADMSYFFPKWKYFKSISLYTEPGIWFAPSDVVSQQAWRTRFTIGFGGRISLF